MPDIKNLYKFENKGPVPSPVQFNEAKWCELAQPDCSNETVKDQCRVHCKACRKKHLNNIIEDFRQ